MLYRNRGDGRFEDATATSGLATEASRWGSGCAFVDVDRDGRFDLFVANYLRFDLATAPEPGAGANCVWKGIPVNCGPKGLPTDTNLLYRNEGNGKFADVSERSRIAAVTGRYFDDRRRRRLHRRRLAGHLCRLGFHRGDPQEQSRRDVHRRGHRKRHRVQRAGKSAGRDGRGDRRLQRRRPG